MTSMGHKNHIWKVDHAPPTIGAHSLAKHRVLRSYLERYVSVLTSDPRQDQFRLTLVDGFAGGGIYLDSRTKEERPGSPLIMLQAMRVAQDAAQELRSKPFNLDVRYFFVEKRRQSFEFLTKAIGDSEFSPQISDKIQLLQGDFESHVPAIIKSIKERGRAGRAIFVLDQCGYTDAPLGTIRNILESLENSEVILTFATDFLISYLNEDEKTQQILEKAGISLPAKSIATAKDAREWRRLIQFALHREIPERTCAKYYTPFFIRSAESNRDLWLVHLSGHYRARDVMVGLHWKECTDFAHYGRSGLRMLGYDQRKDEEWSKQKMLPGFYFDDTALASSQEELIEELPERIHPNKDGIPFNGLFAELTNDCPVTAEIMMDVVSDLARQGIVRIVSKKGTSRRRGLQHGTDIIIPSRQTRIFT